MSDTIFLRIGNSDEITLPALVDSLFLFKGLLQNFDAAIAGKIGGLVEWEVVSLQKNSPAVLGVRARSKYKKRPVLAEHIIRIKADVLRNLTLLRTGTDCTQYMSDDSLLRVEKLARKTERLGPMLVYSGEAKALESSEINNKTLANIRELTATSYSAYGTLTGNLQSISVRRGNEFRIWERATDKPISCKFASSIQDEVVTNLLRKEVEVSGTIDFNSKGVPVRVHLENEAPVEVKERTYPSIAEMKGLIHDFTGGVTLKEYLEEIAE
jgi:hypothetical protein